MTISTARLNDAIRTVLADAASRPLNVTQILIRVRTHLETAGPEVRALLPTSETTGRQYRHRVTAALYALTAAGNINRVGRGLYAMTAPTGVAALLNVSAPETVPTLPPVVTPTPNQIATADVVSAALETLAGIDPAELLAAAKRLTREHMNRLRDAEDAIRAATAIAREEIA